MHLATQNKRIEPEIWTVFNVGSELEGSRLTLGMTQNFMKEMAKRPDYYVMRRRRKLPFTFNMDAKPSVGGNIDKVGQMTQNRLSSTNTL